MWRPVAGLIFLGVQMHATDDQPVGAEHRLGQLADPRVGAADAVELADVPERERASNIGAVLSDRSGRSLPLRVRRKLIHVRQGGLSSAVEHARRRAWSDLGWLDLRADLASLPAPRTARVSLTMEPCNDERRAGFKEEAGRVSGADLDQVILLQSWLEAGLRQLYVAWSDGQPAYCQWLIRSTDLPVMTTANPEGDYQSLASDEVLLEGAYTFVRSRGQGAMADCMGQLLRIAHEEGARSAVTCVGDHNVPSLKGCARVGFQAERLRVTTWRFGRRRNTERPGGEAATWQAIA